VGPLGPDGYHPLRSLMVALDGLADTVVARRAPRRTVRCEGLDDTVNLAWQALDALERRTGQSLPLSIAIDKGIPTQAGLGGGSSDAAAALRAADRLYGLDLGDVALEQVAAEVGSDVPFFVRGGAQWAGGRGERLAPSRRPAFAAVIARPAARLSTGAVYGAFDRLPPPSAAEDSEAPDMPGLSSWVRNDLWTAALGLAPEVARAARALRAAGAAATLLCGSGACVAGLCADREAAQRVRAALAIEEAWVFSPAT